VNAATFSRRTALALVAGGALLFVLLLWLIGAGLAHGPLNDGGAHGAGKGLTGYAALSQLLEKQGWEVGQARNESELTAPGIVVLTPPASASGKDLSRVVTARRGIGPTVIVTPKWQAAALDKLPQPPPGAKPGWVALQGAQLPEWKGFLDFVSVASAPLAGGAWTAGDAAGQLPEPRLVLSGRGPNLVPLVEGKVDQRILAAYVADGHWPALYNLALEGSGQEPGTTYPLVVVFEPDLLDNYGLSRREAALYALRLFEATGDGGPRRVTFDLSFNGFARTPNLLTLAFTPPFLAATLCLLLAALIVGWRAFLRFGPAHAGGPPQVAGKAQLVANAGGIVRRSGRLHLLGPPYAALLRDRLARALALPRQTDHVATEAALDRALAYRGEPDHAFSATVDALRRARRPAELLRAAQSLAALERTLTR